MVGVPEREKEDQEIEKLFEKIMKENFPNLAKVIDFQEDQRVSKKLDPRKHTPRYIIITLPEIKEMERILEAAREKKIKTMSIKIAINSQLSTIESKKRSKQVEQKQNHRYGVHLGGYQLLGVGEQWGKRFRD